MATNTTNLNLIKPAGSERVQISQINQNMDILDEKIGAVGNTSVQSQITATNGLIDSLKNQIVIPQAFSGDCNSINETCVVYATDTATNSPGSWSILTTTVYDASNAIWQTGMNVINGTMKVRHKNGNGWSAWTSQVLQTIIVTSVSNLQATLLAKAQTMGSEGIENIKIIFNGSNEGVFANGNYYCGWIAINSAGSNWLYFSGVLKGLYGADTIEFTYANGTWSFHKLSVIKYVEVTVPNGTGTGIYKVGTLSSLGIPTSATILSAQCFNAHASLCVVTGFAVHNSDVYVYVAQPVQVADGLVRITYMI